MVTLAGAVLLVGGRNEHGQVSDQLYRLDPVKQEWERAPVQGMAVPPLYRHSAVTYTVGGAPRVLLCGGLNATTNAAINKAYELWYNDASDAYVFTEISPMPLPLFGHSLAVGSDSEVYLSGGLWGQFEALPTAALPPRLAKAMNSSLAFEDPQQQQQSGSGPAVASARVYIFTRDAAARADPTATGGNWSLLSSAARPVAFHTSWVSGSALYMYGGAQGRAETIVAAPYGLQIVRLSGGYNLPAVQEASTRWGAVQPGSLSGAAFWVNDSSAATTSEARVWLFGGWQTPQPLLSWADSYISPQDSSLTWRLTEPRPGTDPLDVPRWLAPLPGGMALRAAAGLMTVPMTVGGARKLLVLGGRARKGWTGAGAGNTALPYPSDELKSLSLPPENGPLDSALSYQLYDIWLIDQATGAREPVWNVNGSSSPFGTLGEPASVGRLWDRRLLEFRTAGTNAGGGSTALYIQAEEASATLQPGIWRLTLSVSSLVAADGAFNVSTAAWEPLLPPGTVPEACYPRSMYGAAHLVSNANAASYMALHGGLTLRAGGASMWVAVNDSTCLLELAPNRNTTRWLRQPGFASYPQARYRHACAAGNGLPGYSMTCYGGINDGGQPLADAWTLTLPAGLIGSDVPFSGLWVQASANYSAPRPGPRADHWLLSVRGAPPTNTFSTSSIASSTQQPSEAAFLPLLLVGGSPDANVSTVAPPPWQALWLLEAAACYDPDLPAVSDRRAQVWLSVAPGGGGALQALAASAGGGMTAWALAGAGLFNGEFGSELLLLLAEGAPGEVGEVRALRAVARTEGCLSNSVRPYCSNLSYAYETVVDAGCWNGTTATRLNPFVTNPDAQTLDLFNTAGGFVVLDPDGAALHFKSQVGKPGSYSLDGVRVPAGLSVDNLTVVAYGKPYVELGRKDASGNWTVPLPTAYRARVKVRYPDGAVLAGASAELRVRGPDGLVRRRRALGSPDPDSRTTDSGGGAEFALLKPDSRNPTGFESPQYAIVVTPANSKTSYTAVLQSPVAAASTTAAWSNEATGVKSVLLPSTDAGSSSVVSYNITLPSPPPPPPPPDTSTPVLFNITFATPNGTVNLPTLRRWTATFSFRLSETAEEQRYALSAPYGSKVLPQLSMEPGSYTLEMSDANLTSHDLKPSPAFFDVPPAKPLPTGSGRQHVVSLAVPLSAVWLSAGFSGTLAGSPGRARPLHVMVRVATLATYSSSSSSSLVVTGNGGGSSSNGGSGMDGSLSLPGLGGFGASPLTSVASAAAAGGGGGGVEVQWEDQLVDDGVWALLPGESYRATFHFPGQIATLHAVDFTAPRLGPDGSGGYQRLDVTLPQTLLCGGQNGQQTLPLDGAKGRLPPGPGPAGQVAYAAGSVCNWRISTGLPILTLRISFSGLGPADVLTVTTDSGGTRTVAGPIGTWYTRELVSNASITFRAANDSVMDYFVVEWEASAAGLAMPPQFVMMIAASSAAAGAMLLFLCLWHCVFRPVQMRRRQAAAARSAAANPAADPAAGAAAGGRGAHRNRVPRRYLRLMATTTYSAKDATTAAAAAGLRLPTATAAAVAVAVTNPPLSKDNPKVDGKNNDEEGEEGGRGRAAAADVQGQQSARQSGADAGPTPDAAAAAATRLAASSGPNSAPACPSDPASHSQPETPGGELCAICLCEFEEGERIKYLPCKHFYHVACIDQWLGRDITCPLCKDNVLEALREKFGPLPPRPPRPTQGGRVEGEADGGAAAVGGDAATAVGAPPGAVPGNGDAAAAASAADGGGGGGGVAVTATAAGADLEMVVILPHDHPAAAAAATDAAAGAPRTVSPPGSGPAIRHAAASVRQPAADAADADIGVTLQVRAASSPSPAAAAAAAASTAAVGAPGPGAPLVIMMGSAAVHGGIGGGGILSTSTSRELRPMRRNISTDLTVDNDGTSSDSDSSDSEYDTGPRQHRHGAASSATASTRAFQVVPGPPPPPAFAAAPTHLTFDGGGGGGDSGNQMIVVLPPLATATAASGGGGGGASSYFEAGGLSPSPRPVAEHVQRSLYSVNGGIGGNVTAMRWLSGSSQVAPLPRPGLAALVGGPTVHRLARAQEAQVAAAAAALSAAAAGVSNGGAGSSWRTTSITSNGSTGSPLAPYHHLEVGGGGAAAAAAAAAALLSYRVHTNPLAALSSSGSRSDVAGLLPMEGGAERPSGPCPAGVFHSVQPEGSPKASGAAAASSSPHAPMSVTWGGGPSGRSRPDSAGSGGNQQQLQQARAVPDVSVSCEDILRLHLASPQQQ